MQAILDSIPLVQPPTPTKDGKNQRFQGNSQNIGPAPVAGSKEVPHGEENCLAGLTFVFTGLLESMDRSDGQSLVKRYGGRVTTAPSSKTSYVVLGNDAGPKKLETIRKNNIKTINEDGLFELIRRLPANGGDSKAAAAFEEKQKAETRKIMQMAKEMEAQERQKDDMNAAKKAVETERGSNLSLSKQVSGRNPVENRLWTDKYAPSQMSQICGNKGQVEKLQRWLRNFSKTQKKGFKLPGPDASGVYRAVIISGPPGIGKTTAAHLVARLEGYDVLESNASDTRSKKLVEESLKGMQDTSSLFGYFAEAGQKVEASKRKVVLIMDEVDGMSAGDRGGVGALASVCRKTEVPMILICNERSLPKMKPFDHVAFNLPFRRPTVENIRSRIMTIAFREGLKIPPNVVNALIEGCNADIRQVVNMLSTAKLDRSGMDFEKGKEMSKAWEKHVVLKPWDIVGKILGGGMFAESSKATLNDKIELYFNDHEFSSLMLQENYLFTNPIISSRLSGTEKDLKVLELVDKAAESISDGDLVDTMIRSQQQWSLMPTHAVFGFVRPARFVSGSMAGNRTAFTQWLGKNSSQNKFFRMTKELHEHMRQRSSGDTHEIRQQYIPLLWLRLIKKLQIEGKDAIPEIIELMDSYFLTYDDWDAIMALGVGPMDQENVKIESNSKSAFTRLYNQQSHPLAFSRATNVMASRSRAKERPDLEEAIDPDEGDVIEEPKNEENEDDADPSKDKFVKIPKKKAAPKKSAPPARTKTAAKRSRVRDESEDETPKKSKKWKGGIKNAWEKKNN